MSTIVWSLLAQLECALCLYRLYSCNGFWSKVTLCLWNISFCRVHICSYQNIVISSMLVDFRSWLGTPICILFTIAAFIILIAINIQLDIARFSTINKDDFKRFLIELSLGLGLESVFFLGKSEVEMCTSEIFNDLLSYYFPLWTTIDRKPVFTFWWVIDTIRTQFNIWGVRFLMNMIVRPSMHILIDCSILRLEGRSVIAQHQMRHSYFCLIDHGCIAIILLQGYAFLVKHLPISCSKIT